jgi:hypothetical protein
MTQRCYQKQYQSTRLETSPHHGRLGPAVSKFESGLSLGGVSTMGSRFARANPGGDLYFTGKAARSELNSGLLAKSSGNRLT